jgi:hypothetical protein
MTITQRSAFQKITFEFNEDSLTYTRETLSQKVVFLLEYDAFPTERHLLEERSLVLATGARMGILWGVFHVISQYFTETPAPSAALWLLPGLLCLLGYRLSHARYLVHEMGARQIFILEDRQTETILKTIHAHRIGQIRKRYARVIDPSEPNREVARFKALLDEKIITQDDFDDLMIDLRLGISANMPLDE